MATDNASPAEFPEPLRRQRFVDVCPQLTAIFERYARTEHMPGVVFGVVVDTDLVFTKGLGERVTGHPGTPNENSVFRIASMTKSFTAAAILRLRDAGKLALDDPISTWVPELARLIYPSTDARDITIRELLTMSAGWPQDDPWADRQLYRDDVSVTELYREGVTFSNPPGVTFEYSNYAYIVLGRIVTRVCAEPAMDYIARVLLKPLGMESTLWQLDAITSDNHAPGYRWEDQQWREEQPSPSGGDVAAFAGLCSTISDLSRWVELFLSAWPPRNTPDNGPISRATLREMQQIARPFDPYLETRTIADAPLLHAGGYGFGLSTVHNGRWARVGHGGGLPGFGSHMCWAPAYGVGVIALANVTYANVHDACGAALDTLIDQAETQPRLPVTGPALQNAHDDLRSLLNVWDDKVADRLFADNFFLDRDRGHWQKDLARLGEIHGKFVGDTEVKAVNWLRGERRLEGERGWCVVWATLSPTVPARVQTLKVQSVLPPSATLQSVADRLMVLTARPRRGELDRLLSSSCDRDLAWKQLRLVNIELGVCKIHAVTRGDGQSFAEFSIEGGGRLLALELGLNQRGKLTKMNFLLE